MRSASAGANHGPPEADGGSLSPESGRTIETAMGFDFCPRARVPKSCSTYQRTTQQAMSIGAAGASSMAVSGGAPSRFVPNIP